MEKLFGGVTKKQSTEFGQLAILLVLFRTLYIPDRNWIVLAFALTLLTMILPSVFYPFAVVWSGLSKLLNAISSRIMMGLVFFGIVVPVGLVRKWMGSDPLKVKQFKKGRESVMTSRDHAYTGKDLENTF
ncbi:MAG TPA: hypothetical protein VF939_04040 [Puia sp.]